MADKNAKAKAMTKSAVFVELATKTKLTRKQVADVFTALSGLIKSQLGKKGPGQFTIPSLLKLKSVHKAATKARPGKNPFTGAAITIKAKPARNVVRARPLKGLNEMIK